jgi:hypothetical protein
MEGRAVVHVLQPGQELPIWQIFVKLLDGKTRVLQVTAHMLVKEVQQMLEDSEGTSACKQRLLYAGSQLQPMRELWEHSVMKEATLHLVLRLAGC